MDNTFAHTHGTLMVVAWLIFGSTGVLFARYGRVLRFRNQRQLLGKSIWFQFHRFLLSLSSLLTLIGFFFIIMYSCDQQVNPNSGNKQLFAHSVIGGSVVCCILLQIWLSLYRCHPNSHFRFIFNWTHHIIGYLTSVLAFTNLFLITFVLTQQTFSLIIIISLWSGWMVIILVLFEIIEYQHRKALALMSLNARINNTNENPPSRNGIPDIEAGTNPPLDNQRLNQVKLILLCIHLIISIILSLPFIILIWN